MKPKDNAAPLERRVRQHDDNTCPVCATFMILEEDRDEHGELENRWYECRECGYCATDWSYFDDSMRPNDRVEGRGGED